MSAEAPAAGKAGLTLFCLLFTGTMLAVTILISKLAAQAGAPMLWFLAVTLIMAGLIELALAARLGQLRDWRPLLPYSVGSGFFLAAPLAMGYLSVAHVGAGYVAMSFAFPILLTWVMARLMGLERASGKRLAGVILGLTGGVILASGKLGAEAGPAVTGWVLLATAIPLVLAAGNIYRSRFWPRGAQPVALAALMLLVGGALTLPFAIATESVPAALWQNPVLRLLVVLDVAVFVTQYVTYFMLQRLGGPVTLSLIGPVAALIGGFTAMVSLGETLPRGYALAGGATLIGVWLMIGAPGIRARRRAAG